MWLCETTSNSLAERRFGLLTGLRPRRPRENHELDIGVALVADSRFHRRRVNGASTLVLRLVAANQVWPVTDGAAEWVSRRGLQLRLRLR